MGDLSTIIDYALEKAVQESKEDMICKCIDHGAVIRTEILQLHLQMKECPVGGLAGYRGSYDSSCPIFKILINNISWTTIPECLLQQYANHTNPYYLETVLTTKEYEPNSKVLLGALKWGWTPQYTIDLLFKYGFGTSELDVVILGIIREFYSYGLSKLIATKVNLVPYQYTIFAFFDNLYKQTPNFNEVFRTKTCHIKCTLDLLINYLTTNPHSTTNYMMVRYLRDNTLLGMSDIAESIWHHYLNITVRVHSDYINFYQSITKSLLK
jgi:hypothetical protein